MLARGLEIAPGESPSRLGRYRIVESLGRGGMGLVYRAVDEQSGRSVALKTVRLASEKLLKRLRREIHALARLEHPGIVRIVDHGVDGGSPWYAMELLEGVSLAIAFGRGHDPPGAIGGTLSFSGESARGAAARGPAPAPAAAPMVRSLEPSEVARILTMVRRFCSPLSYLHGEGLVHRDLKPSNILIRPDGRPVLVDFGLTSEFGAKLSRETLASDHESGGTAPYMAPEQIRGEFVDARADLYALGCILYELLTGLPPFSALTVGGLLDGHLSAAPPPPSALAAGLPPGTDELLATLLAKDPRARLGHAGDLAARLAELGAAGDDTGGSPAPEGRAYLYRPRLVERDDVLDRLEALLDRVEPAPPVMIGGESGVGKTRLVMELSRKAAARRVGVIAGEGRDGASVPLELLRGVLLAVVDRCREDAGAAARILGDNLEVLAPYEPSLAPLAPLPDLPALPALPEETARRRLFRALGDTLSALARDQPLLLILDDLQWADELSLGFLDFLAAEETPPVQIVGTYRTEEVGPKLSELLQRVTSIRLERLPPRGIHAVVSDMLAIADPPATLLDFVGAQSEGNPFFVGEYLLTAIRDGVVYRDSLGKWQVSREAENYRALTLPDSLRDLVYRRFRELDDSSRHLVELAAVIGRTVSLDLLEAAAGLPESEIFEAVGEILRRRVLEELEPGRLRFVHDKIREAAYLGLGQNRLRDLHQTVAETLDGRGGWGEDVVFALARHYAQGWINRDPQRVFAANVTAARRALQDYAPAEAHGFFRHAAAAGIEMDADTCALWGEACIRSNLVDEADRRLNEAIAKCGDPIARGRMRTRLAFVHQSRFESHLAWRECEKAFVDLGAPLSGSKLRQISATLWDWLRALSAGRGTRRYGNVEGAEHERLAALGGAYQIAQFASYYQMNAINWIQLALRALYPANRIGPSRQMVEAYSGYAMGLASMKLSGVAERYSARAIEIAESLHDRHIVAFSKICRALATSMGGRVSEAVSQMREALAQHGNWLDGLDYINATGDLTWNLAIRGFAREAWETQTLMLRKLEKRADAGLPEGHAAFSQQLVILPMLGRADEALPYLGHARRLAEEQPDNIFHTSFIHCNLVMFHQEQGEFGDPLEHAIRTYKQVSPAPRWTLYHMRGFYVFQAYARLAQCLRPHAEDRPAAVARLGAAVRELARAALMPIFRCHLHVLQGACERLRGRHASARAKLDAAERLARAIDCPWVLFEVARQAAHASAQAGDRAGAAAHSRRARTLAAAHGLAGRERLIAEEIDA